ncbi:fucosyltransferase [Bacteroidales bacterium]|nr:fucosyltransferase [Bacteroidales bacterium]
MISIVIPLYNKQDQIKNALDSVFAQTFQDFEIIIVNDGSTDNSLAIVEINTDCRIRLISQENQGVSAARNRGIAMAKYNFIALLDADDYWKPDYLSTQVGLIESFSQCSVYVCAYEFRNVEGKVLPAIINKLPFNTSQGLLDNYFEVASSSHPPICSINVVAKKTCFLEIGGFPLGVHSGEDLLTWAKLAMKYKIAYSTKKNAVYNFNFNQFNNSPRNLNKSDIMALDLQKLQKENPELIGLRHYISLWHKTQLSILMRFPTNFRLVFREAFLSLKYNPLQAKIIIYLLISFLPLRLRLKLFKFSSMNTQ